MRRARQLLTAVVALGLVLAFAVPALADDPTIPVLGFTFDPLAGPEPENVLDVQQPNWANAPIYDRNFGSGLAQTTPGSHESITVGGAPDGTAYVYVVSPKTKQVSMYDAVTLALRKTFGRQVQGPQFLNDPVGVAYYRNELYVLDRYRPYQDHARIVVYDWDGNFQREIPLFNPLGQVDLTGIDLAWGEAWVTGEVCGGFAGVVEILDATTGALKAVTAQLAHAPTGDPAHLCDSASDSSAWWDISLIPESGTGVAGYRMLDRWGGVSGATAPDAEPLCYLCYRPLWEGGTDDVWGMRWFLSVDGGPSSVPGSEVTEYSVESNQAGHPYLQQRRAWHPTQTSGVSDIVYQNRETRIDWDGQLTTQNWMRGRRCLSYVVSDADFFAAGDQVEHWWEQARNFQSAVVKLDGTQATLIHPDGTAIAQPLTSAADTICLETNSIASGQHTLSVVATVATQQVTATNPTLRIDHTVPDGTVTYPGKVLRDIVTVSGTVDDHGHSGERDWQLTQMPLGSSTWTPICAPATTPYQCAWPTAKANSDGSRMYPDGKYYLRAHVRDLVTDPYGGPNEADSAVSAPVIVDNTPPTFTLSGPLSPGSAAGTLPDGQYGLTVAAADGSGSGVNSVQVFVDGTQRDSISQPCADYACTISRTYTLHTDDYSEGAHTIRVLATDFAGFTRDQTWTVTTQNAPTLVASGELKDAESYAPILAGETRALHVDGADGDSGVAQVDLSIDNVSRATTASTALDYTYNSADYPDGEHTVAVSVTDRAGHKTAQSWTVFQDTAPRPTPAQEAADTAEDPAPEQDQGGSTAATTSMSTALSPSSALQTGPVVDDQTPALPVDLGTTNPDYLACTAADTLPNFDRYSLGGNFEGLSLTHVLRRCDVPDPDSSGRANYVSYIYGDCTPDVNDDDSYCAFPLEVQSWPACERYRDMYDAGPDMGPLSRTDTSVNGVPAALFDRGLRLEIYTGASTIVIFGNDSNQILRAGAAVQKVAPATPLGTIPTSLISPPVLPGPVPGALDGELVCR